MKIKYNNYGRLTVGSKTYALLRPIPFEPEHTFPGAVAFFVADSDNGFSNPHILKIVGPFFIDELSRPEVIDVTIGADNKEALSENIFELKTINLPIK